MALRESTRQADADLFRQELVNLIDMRHELFALASKIDWAALEDRFGKPMTCSLVYLLFLISSFS
jgi:hypothetical protein